MLFYFVPMLFFFLWASLSLPYHEPYFSKKNRLKPGFKKPLHWKIALNMKRYPQTSVWGHSSVHFMFQLILYLLIQPITQYVQIILQVFHVGINLFTGFSDFIRINRFFINGYTRFL